MSKAILRKRDLEILTPHFLLIGDVGGPETYHAGDEGMLDANLDRLRNSSPQATFTVISRDPDWTAQTYDTEAIEPIGFPDATAESQESEERLEAVVGAAASGELASGFERRAQALDVIDAVRRADAVVISGGGNLNATWPEHLYERIALLTLAERLDTPAVVLGQTIGPQLTEVQRRRLAESLRTARLVGVRERGSYDLVETLGVPNEIIDYQLDDAIFLGRLFSDPDVPRPELERPYLALTLCGEIDGLEALASQVESLAETMKADIVFLPHAQEPDRDRELGARFGEALSSRDRFHLLGVLPAREVAAITGAAEMVISTRYHPLVFASAMGVPSLGLSTDAYTHQKLAGTHSHAGLEDWVLPIELAVGGLLAPAALELWVRRNEVKLQITEQLPRWEAMHDLHWRRVAEALDLEGEKTHDLEVSRPVVETRVPAQGEWRRAADVYMRVVALRESELMESKQYAEGLLRVVEARDEEINSLQAILARSEREAVSLQQTLDKSRETVGAREQEIESLQEVLRAREKELTSLRSTLAARDEELSSSRPVLSARDEELAALRPVLSARDEELAALRPVLSARDEELAALRPVLSTKNEELDSLRPILASKEEELFSIKSVLAAREEELANVHANLADLRAELTQSDADLVLAQEALARSEAKLSAYRNSFPGKMARRFGISPEGQDG